MSLVRSSATALLCGVVVVVGSRSDAARASRLEAAAYLAPAVPRDGAREPIGAAAARAMRRGALPADPEALDRAKAAADAAAADEPPAGLGPFVGDDPLEAVELDEAGGVPRAVSPAPQARPSWKGIAQAGGTPSDSTGAIGTARYIEVVNSRVGVYDRAGALLATAGLASWWNVGSSANVFDPQVIWDAGSERFYYAGDAVFSDSDNQLAFGWSTTASPGLGPGDWCRYTVKYGVEFPDYPKLGDSADFLLIGVNVFSGDRFRGADVVAIGKPAAGTACPGFAGLKLGIGRNLAVSGIRQFTPVPANQTDPSRTAWVVTVPATLPAASLGLFKVTRNADGSPRIQTSGASATVPGYSVPRNAPQSGTRYLLDSGDGRLTQAVSAIDPLHSGKIGIWTQHTVYGGAGALVRWYEIDPLRRTLLQSGAVQSRSLYAFNGAVSPDRVVSRSTKAFGGGMVLGYNTSSATTFPAIAMVAKRGRDTASSQVAVKTSPGPVIDFSCADSGSVCRWGDYAAATPDPAAATTGATGRVWLTGAWTRDGRLTGTEGTSWQTWNWAAQP